jgi:predicted dehydrogenase
MADTIRTGIVGATVTQGGSGWGANAHVPALHLLPDYTLQAVCTAHEDTAQASKATFDAVHAFHDIDAMAQHPEIDLVVVCVRVPGHKNLVMAGLHANKAVCCEWPWAPPWQRPRRWRPLRRRAASRPLLACRRAATRR